jgi:hypothetical protein
MRMAELYGFTDFKRHTGEQSSATANERSLGEMEADALQAVAIQSRWQDSSWRVARKVWCASSTLTASCLQLWHGPPASEDLDRR